MRRPLQRLKAVLPLLVLAVVCVVLLSRVAGWSAPRIEQQQERLRLEVLAGILPAGLDATALGKGRLLSAAEILGTDSAVRVYRLQRDRRWLGVLIEILSHDGYQGDIRLGVVIGADGILLGVRALQQHETRDLGNAIDYRVSPWMDQFRGRGREPEAAWRLREYGGNFDQISGATVTSRAVLRAVYRCVRLFHEYHDLFASWPQPDCAILSRGRSACR